MLDEGKTLPFEHQRQVRRLANKPEEAWTDSDIKFLFSSLGSDPRKSTYGSKFAYAPDPDVQKTNTGLERSWAMGGFSNVWGAAVLPYTVEQVHSWGVDIDEWQHAQNALIELLRISNASDHWARHFPVLGSQVRCGDLDPEPSPIIQKFLEKFKASALSRSNRIRVGRALLAWRKDATRCTGCRLCLAGCPYDLFYNAANSVRELQRNGLFYRVVKVMRVSRIENRFRLDCVNEDEDEWVDARRVFTGAGPLGTAELLLRSNFIKGGSIELKDSRYFLFPVLRVGGRLPAASTIAAASVFVEMYGATPAGDVHLQVYDACGPTFDYLLTNRAKKMPGGSILMDLVRGRLLLIQGLLHSQMSGTIEVTHTSGGLRVRGHEAARSLWPIARAFLTFLRTFAPLGFVPLPVIEFAPLGLGQHVGAAFPMKANPGPLETDLYGQWPDAPGLYIIDASSLPDIPPHTITLSIMTNAYRIATHAK